MRRVEVAIVGGGVMGAAAAWRLATAGREVLLLERDLLAGPAGSSHGSTRIFRYAYEEAFYARLAARALPLWRELEADAGEALLDFTGGLDSADPPVLDAVESAMAAAGVTAERVAPGDERFPGVRLSRPALYTAQTAVIAASQAVRAMARLAASRGAEVREHTPASIESADEDGILLRAQGERVGARRCVVAAGGWTGSLLAPLGISPPLRVTREQIAYLPQRTQMPVVIERGSLLRYALPARFGAPGLKVGEHGAGREVDVRARTFERDDAALERLLEFVRAALPGAEPTPVGVETCLYTNTPDEDFVIDRSGALVIASPCSGHGFKFAPLIGEILACLTLDREPPVDTTRFSLSRFR